MASYADAVTITASALDLLTLLRLPGVGPRNAVKRIEEGDQIMPESESYARARAAVASIVEDCETMGVGIVGWFDKGFPVRLHEIPDPPAVLFYRGKLSLANHLRSVAIVGTREPTRWGQTATRTITDRFAADGWVVVSGLALGVDTIAHVRSIEHGAPTVAVLGNGLSSIYPAANRQLGERIVEAGGLLLAEVPPRDPVKARALVRRDRLQSGLTSVTVICQGGRRSGAMHTARYAAEQGRALDVAAFPRDDEPVGEQDEGTQALLKQPATRLPDLLPPWRSATRRATAASRPIALPIDEGTLANLDGLERPGQSASEQHELF
jgi:DNA processing protein